jgi:hypothetical protein
MSRETKSRFRIEKLEPRIAPAGFCITADPLFCGTLGGEGGQVTADGPAYDGMICAGDNDGSLAAAGVNYTLTTGGGNEVVAPTEATLGICSGVFGPGPLEDQVPCA